MCANPGKSPMVGEASAQSGEKPLRVVISIFSSLFGRMGHIPGVSPPVLNIILKNVTDIPDVPLCSPPIIRPKVDKTRRNVTFRSSAHDPQRSDGRQRRTPLCATYLNPRLYTVKDPSSIRSFIRYPREERSNSAQHTRSLITPFSLLGS